MSFYVYMHTRLSDGKPFYIGKGQGKRAREKTSGRTKHWRHVATKHGYAVQILAHWETEQEALDHEILLIKCFRELGCDLVNLTDGGEGTSGWKAPQEWRDRQAARMIGNSRRAGIPHSAQDKQRIGAAQAGIAKSAEHRAKISEALKGKIKSEDHRLKLSFALKDKPGRPFTEQQKQKLSDSQKSAWAKRKAMT